MPLSAGGREADALIQGTAMLDDLGESASLELLTEIAALGARTLDLAHSYGGGISETLVGSWAEQHGVRDELFLITKGGHPVDGRGRITRGDVRSDLEASLERLRTDHVDLYLLHRDDEEVPVDEIVDFADELCREKTIRAYGTSNWRHERFEAARRYARREGRAEPVATSPHFSLAVPTRPPWPGCVSIAGEDGAAARAFYARERIPVLAWASLAMGFFALDSSAIMGREQSMSSDVFGSPSNDARRDRARLLAAEEGQTPTQIALRWALSQPITVHAIVGCRSAREYEALRTAADEPLSPDQVRWLDRGGTVAD